MSERDDIRDIHLSALLDGELGAERRAELERAITADPALAARLDAMRADKEMLQRLYAPLAQRPLPQAWLDAVHDRRPRVSWRLTGSIAAALLVAVIGIATYMELRTPAPADIVELALDARANATRPVRTIAAGEGVDMARYDADLKNAVGMRARVPDMRAAGYRLASIRVYDGAAAELVYRDREGHVFTLYVTRSDGTVEFVQFERRGLRVCVWRDDAVSMVMAGDMSTAAMQRLAVLAYSGLTA